MALSAPTPEFTPVQPVVQSGAALPATPAIPRQETSTSHLLDIQGAARFLGLTPWQIRGILSDGELRCIRVGRKLYMRRAALIRWAENSEEKYRVQ